jgi:hypothetical protein
VARLRAAPDAEVPADDLVPPVELLPLKWLDEAGWRELREWFEIRGIVRPADQRRAERVARRAHGMPRLDARTWFVEHEEWERGLR